MHFKSLLSGLLAASLLAMSSWASACDLSCSLQRVHCGCPLTAPAEGQPAEIMSAGMNMSRKNPKAAAEVESTSQARSILVMDASCRHELCSEPADSATVIGGDHRGFSSARKPAISLTLRLPQSFHIGTEASPPEVAAISLLFINLRI
jgi:hypothetical protein